MNAPWNAVNMSHQPAVTIKVMQFLLMNTFSLTNTIKKQQASVHLSSLFFSLKFVSAYMKLAAHILIASVNIMSSLSSKWAVSAKSLLRTTSSRVVRRGGPHQLRTQQLLSERWVCCQLWAWKQITVFAWGKNAVKTMIIQLSQRRVHAVVLRR